jgi:hypothetical protein
MAKSQTKSQSKSQRPQTRGVTRPRPAIIAAARCHIRPRQATSSDGTNAPYKQGSLVRTQLRPPGKPGDRPPIRYWGGHTGSAVLAADTVAVAVESVDVGSDHLDGPLNVGGAVAAAACTVDVASDRDTGAAVVRVALLGLLCSYRDDPGDWRSDNYLPDQFFVYLNPVAERHLIGKGLHPSDAMASYPGVALRKRRIIHSHRLERDCPPAGNDTLLDYWRGLRRGA